MRIRTWADATGTVHVRLHVCVESRVYKQHRYLTGHLTRELHDMRSQTFTQVTAAGVLLYNVKLFLAGWPETPFSRGGRGGINV